VIGKSVPGCPLCADTTARSYSARVPARKTTTGVVNYRFTCEGVDFTAHTEQTGQVQGMQRCRFACVGAGSCIPVWGGPVRLNGLGQARDRRTNRSRGLAACCATAAIAHAAHVRRRDNRTVE